MPVRFKAPNLVLTLGWSVNLQKAQKIKSKNLQVNNSTENAFNVLFYGLLIFSSGQTLYDLKMVELNSIIIETERYLNTNVFMRQSWENKMYPQEPHRFL